jgi:hypothetical protein
MPNWQALTSRITDTRRRMLRSDGVAEPVFPTADFGWRTAGTILPLSNL